MTIPYRLIEGDCEKVAIPAPVHLIVTSPPYVQRRKQQYGGVDPADFPAWMVRCFAHWDKSLAPGASIVLNIRAGRHNKRALTWDMRTILALEDAGWVLRDTYIWHKASMFPGVWVYAFANAWEYITHWSRDEDLHAWNAEDVKERRKHQGRIHKASTKRPASDLGIPNRHRAYIFTIAATSPYVSPDNVISCDIVHPSANYSGHPAVFPATLPSFFIRLLSNPGDVVLDPFAGSGTTLVKAIELGRQALGIEIKPEYVEIMKERLDWAEVPFL